MQRLSLVRITRVVPTPLCTIRIGRSYGTKNSHTNKSQPSTAQNPSPQNKKAPVEEPGNKEAVYTQTPPNASQSPQKSNDNRHSYAKGTENSEAAGEATAVQKEKSREKETIKPKSNKDPRALQ